MLARAALLALLAALVTLARRASCPPSAPPDRYPATGRHPSGPIPQAHQGRLQRRTEQLELQLAQYNSLLAAAEGVAQVPRVAAAASSPRGSPSSGGRRSAAGASGSPVQVAITALQMRRAVEEAGALREQLSAAQAEAAGARR